MVGITKRKKDLIPFITKNSKWLPEAVYQGAPLQNIPERGMTPGVLYRVEGHPYWVVDVYDGQDNLIKGWSTGVSDSDTAIHHKQYMEGEAFEGNKVQSGKYKNYDVSSPFKKMMGNFKPILRSASRARSLGGLAAIPAGLIASAFMSPENAEATMKYTSAAVDPIGSLLFPYGEGFSKGTPNMKPWMRRVKDPNWGGGLLR